MEIGILLIAQILKYIMQLLNSRSFASEKVILLYYVIEMCLLLLIGYKLVPLAISYFQGREVMGNFEEDLALLQEAIRLIKKCIPTWRKRQNRKDIPHDRS